MNKMKPEDVMKALELCDFNAECDDCPYVGRCWDLNRDALALLREKDADISWSAERIIEADNRIKELETENMEISGEVERLKVDNAEKDAEIERLTKELDGQFEKWKMLSDKTERHYGELYEEAKQVVRAEAITEFAERLKTTLITKGIYPVIVKNSICQIAKEMKEKADERSD